MRSKLGRKGIWIRGLCPSRVLCLTTHLGVHHLASQTPVTDKKRSMTHVGVNLPVYTTGEPVWPAINHRMLKKQNNIHWLVQIQNWNVSNHFLQVKQIYIYFFYKLYYVMRQPMQKLCLMSSAASWNRELTLTDYAGSRLSLHLYCFIHLLHHVSWY